MQRRGHIVIKGFVSNLKDTCSYKLNFEKEIDQTYIEEFTKSMGGVYEKYLGR